jgi:hypothetical protein
VGKICLQFEEDTGWVRERGWAWGSRDVGDNIIIAVNFVS